MKQAATAANDRIQAIVGVSKSTAELDFDKIDDDSTSASLRTFAFDDLVKWKMLCESAVDDIVSPLSIAPVDNAIRSYRGFVQTELKRYATKHKTKIIRIIFHSVERAVVVSNRLNAWLADWKVFCCCEIVAEI